MKKIIPQHTSYSIRTLLALAFTLALLAGCSSSVTEPESPADKPAPLTDALPGEVQPDEMQPGDAQQGDALPGDALSPPDDAQLADAEPQPDDASELPSLTGFSEGLNTDAQKLYAKARIMWNAAEKCSNPELAIEYLEVAITLEPEYADAYMRKALAASELGEWDEAFDDSSRAIRLEPKADNYALRSLVFLREGNYKGARKDLERALKLDPQNSRAKEYMKNLQRLQSAS